MKWFQHQTDASDDIKIKRLEDKFGITGYGIFFKIVEKVGKEGQKFILDTKKYPMDVLAKDFRVKKTVFDECLTFMSEISLVVLKNDKIHLPKMKKYASNWVKRTSVGTTEERQRNDRATTAKEEIRRDKNKTKESISYFFNKNEPAPANVKVKYLNNDMRWKDAERKWYVIENGNWYPWVGTNVDVKNITWELK